MLSGRQAATQGLVRRVREKRNSHSHRTPYVEQRARLGEWWALPWGRRLCSNFVWLIPCGPRELCPAAGSRVCSGTSQRHRAPGWFPVPFTFSQEHLPGAEPRPAVAWGCSFAPTRKRVPVTAGALRCLLLLCSLSSEGKLWWEMLCCFGGPCYFSVKMKEMIWSLRGGGDGAIPASSYLHLLPQSWLAVAGLAAAGCGPQLRARPG